MLEYQSVVVPILRWLNSQPGVKAINIHGSVYQERGTPDILGSWRGRVFALEVKRPGGRVAPIQERRLREWAAAGAVSAVVCSLEDCRAVLEREGLLL